VLPKPPRATAVEAPVPPDDETNPLAGRNAAEVVVAVDDERRQEELAHEPLLLPELDHQRRVSRHGWFACAAAAAAGAPATAGRAAALFGGVHSVRRGLKA
jgi:hypothetical protein